MLVDACHGLLMHDFDDHDEPCGLVEEDRVHTRVWLAG